MNENPQTDLTALRIAACELMGWKNDGAGHYLKNGCLADWVFESELPNPTTYADDALALVGLLEEQEYLIVPLRKHGEWWFRIYDDERLAGEGLESSFALALTRAAVQVLRRENV